METEQKAFDWDKVKRLAVYTLKKRGLSSEYNDG